MLSLFDNLETFTVSALTAQVKGLLERTFAGVSVVGEISSCKRHAGSGHIYLTLKDPGACLACVIWRSTAQALRVELEQGMTVLARGRLSVYPEQGKYQLYIDDIQPQGLGVQDLALRRLKEKLARLGYFAAERKKPLPPFPRRLALVTSPAGAAVRDMLEILGRRWPLAEVWVCPVRVQGPGAAEEIAYALHRLGAMTGIDAILLGRGGGSNEDLAAFNEEIVAQAIFRSRIPIVSAVGHEIDVTLADLVADHRALTPSEAAEIATPDRRELWKALKVKEQRLVALLQGKMHYARERWLSLAQRPVFQKPIERLREHERRLDGLQDRLRRAMQQRLLQCRKHADALAAHLQSLSPLNVLARGYSLTRTLPDQHVVHSVAQVHPGDEVEILVHDGAFKARIV